MIHNSFHIEVVVVIERTLPPVQWGRSLVLGAD